MISLMSSLRNKIEVFKNKIDLDDDEESNTAIRPYVNVVTIVFIKGNPDMKGNPLHNRDVEKYQENFRITSETSFRELKECALDYWVKNPDYDSFRFYDENFNDILAEAQDNIEEVNANDDEDRVNYFFESFRMTDAILILKQPHYEQKDIIEPQK